MSQNLITPEMHEGELRILDTDLAVRLGFATPRMIRKLIKRYLLELDKLGPRSTVERVVNGGNATEYYLNRKQAIFITAKSETAEATDITIEIIERFDAYERGAVSGTETQTIKSPDHINQLRKASALHGTILAFNRRQGMDKTQARVKALAAVREQTGIDLAKEFGWQTQPLEVQEQTLTATQIGVMLGGMKAQEVNKLLEERGLHTSGRDMRGRKVWMPTPVGRAFGRYEDKAKAHAGGTVQPWVWYPSVVERLRPFTKAPAITA